MSWIQFFLTFCSIVAVQLLNCVWLFMTPWTAAHQASLSFTISQSLLKLMSIEWMMPSNHCILCCPLLLLPSISPSIRIFFPSESAFTSGGQSIGASASASVLPMNIQDWFSLGLTGLISLLSKGLSRVFFSTILWKHRFFVSQPSLGQTLTPVHDYWKNYSFDYTDLCRQSDDVSAFNTLSRFVITFLPRSNCLLISWLQSPSTVILEPKKIKAATVSTFSSSICHEVMGLDAMTFVFLNVEL